VVRILVRAGTAKLCGPFELSVNSRRCYLLWEGAVITEWMVRSFDQIPIEVEYLAQLGRAPMFSSCEPAKKRISNGFSSPTPVA